MNKLKYVSSEQMFEGFLVEVTGGSVTIDLKGRMGQLKVPLRMVISDTPLQVGQTVGFLMSYPEVIEAEPDLDYVATLNETKRRKAEIKREES